MKKSRPLRDGTTAELLVVILQDSQRNCDVYLLSECFGKCVSSVCTSVILLHTRAVLEVGGGHSPIFLRRDWMTTKGYRPSYRTNEYVCIGPIKSFLQPLVVVQWNTSKPCDNFVSLYTYTSFWMSSFAIASNDQPDKPSAWYGILSATKLTRRLRLCMYRVDVVVVVVVVNALNSGSARF